MRPELDSLQESSCAAVELDRAPTSRIYSIAVLADNEEVTKKILRSTHVPSFSMGAKIQVPLGKASTVRTSVQVASS